MTIKITLVLGLNSPSIWSIRKIFKEGTIIVVLLPRFRTGISGVTKHIVICKLYVTNSVQEIPVYTEVGYFDTAKCAGELYY